MIVNLTASDICVDASSMKEAYTKAEQEVSTEHVRGQTKVADIDGDVHSSSIVTVSKTLIFTSRVDTAFCFKISNTNALLTESNNITKDLPLKPKRQPNKLISDDFTMYWNTIAPTFANLSYVKKMGDEDIGWSNAVEYKPDPKKLAEFMDKLDSYGVKKEEDSSIFKKFINFDVNHFSGKYSEQTIYSMPMYDCKGDDPFKMRVYESPKLTRVFLNVVVYFYDDTSAHNRLMVLGDGIVIRSFSINKYDVAKTYKKQIKYVDLYFDIVDEDAQYTKYGYGISNSYPLSMFRPQTHSIKSKVNLNESYDRFQVLTEEFWTTADKKFCGVKY